MMSFPLTIIHVPAKTCSKALKLITGIKVKNYKVDLCNFDDTFAIFQENPDLAGIIHFAAYKSVRESVEKPLIVF